MSTLNKERLARFIAFLKEVPENHFSMTNWQGGPGVRSTPEDIIACNTTACAGGWLAVSPDFKEAGGTVSDRGAPILGSLTQDKAFAGYFGIGEELASHVTCEAIFYGESNLSRVSLSKVIKVLEWILNEDPEVNIDVVREKVEEVTRRYGVEIDHYNELIWEIRQQRDREIEKVPGPKSLTEAAADLFDYN